MNDVVALFQGKLRSGGWDLLISCSELILCEINAQTYPGLSSQKRLGKLFAVTAVSLPKHTEGKKAAI